MSLPEGMKRFAHISVCGRYRYTLRREWAVERAPGQITYVMLNPSTADGDVDDPTVRKCIGFARRFNDVNAIEIVNLFAWRATDPRDLGRAPARDIIGPWNDDAIIEAVNRARGTVVVAWGAHAIAQFRHRDAMVLGLIKACGKRPVCLGRAKGGAPRHPLMVAYSTDFEDYEQEVPRA